MFAQFTNYFCVEASQIQAKLQDANFGGGSVTIPLKLDVIPLMSTLSPSAMAIGAVNTIFKDSDFKWVGDNTDWLGILRPISRRYTKTKIPTVLILGAGGTARAACYAMTQLQANLYIFNRTTSKAAEIADYFSATVVESLEKVDIIFDIIIGTIPASAGMKIPEALFHAELIVMDAAYLPAITPLLQQATQKGCSCIQGAEMLYEQALEQYRLWTGTAVPDRIMSEAVWSSVPIEERLN